MFIINFLKANIQGVRILPHKLCRTRILAMSRKKLSKNHTLTMHSFREKWEVRHHIFPSSLEYITSALTVSKVHITILKNGLHYYYTKIAFSFRFRFPPVKVSLTARDCSFSYCTSAYRPNLFKLFAFHILWGIILIF